MSANVGENLKPLSKVASGGELARIMLAMKQVLAQQDGVPTLIFDEVDAGVSGRAAQAAEGQELALTQLLALMQALDERGMGGDVTLIDMSDPAQLTLGYLGRFNVYFPWDADYGYKLDYLLAVVEKLEANEKGVINMMQEGKARFIPE